KHIKNIEIEELYQKIVFELTKTSEIDYGNNKLKQQIFNVIEAHSKLVNQIEQEKEPNYTCQDHITKKIKKASQYQKIEKRRKKTSAQYRIYYIIYQKEK
ncbi:21393_t:CDS:2, partial [Gigaspora margarita]